MDCTLAFDIAHNLRYRILRWYRNQHMDMIRHKVPFDDLALFLSGQIPKNFTQVRTELFVQRLATALRYEHNMILALPFGVT